MKTISLSVLFLSSLLIAFIFILSCADNPTGPSPTATPVPQPTATPITTNQPTTGPTSLVTPTLTSVVTEQPTVNLTSTPTATVTSTATFFIPTATPQPINFTQTFEAGNSQHGLYYENNATATGSFSTAYRYEGDRALEVAYSGSVAPGGIIAIHPQENPSINLNGKAEIRIWIYDGDQTAGRFLSIALEDNVGATSALVTAQVATISDTWRELAFDLNGFSGIDKSAIKFIHLAMSVNAVFAFDFINTP